MKKILVPGCVAIMIFLSACCSSYITSSWKNEKSAPHQYKKILVLGLVNNDEPQLKKMMEAYLAANLRSMGYEAVTSCELFGPNAFLDLRDKEILNSINQTEIDAVLTVVLLGHAKEEVYVPNGPRQMGDFWNYYGGMYNRVQISGHWVTDIRYFWESNFYLMRSGELQYSVQTQSFDPSGAEKFAVEYGLMITKNMTRQKILQQQLPTRGF